MTYFQLIPEELNIEILLYIKIKDFVNLVKIEPYDQLLNNSRIWRILFHRKFTQLDVWDILEPKNILFDPQEDQKESAGVSNFPYYWNIYFISNIQLYKISHIRKWDTFLSFHNIRYIDLSLNLFKKLEGFANYYLEHRSNRINIYLHKDKLEVSIYNSYYSNYISSLDINITPEQYYQLLFYFYFISD